MGLAFLHLRACGHLEDPELHHLNPLSSCHGPSRGECTDTAGGGGGGSGHRGHVDIWNTSKSALRRIKSGLTVNGYWVPSVPAWGVLVQGTKLLSGKCVAVNVGVNGMNVPFKHSTSSNRFSAANKSRPRSRSPLFQAGCVIPPLDVVPPFFSHVFFQIRSNPQAM